MTRLTGLFKRRPRELALAPLYDAIVAVGRGPDWYRRGAVPDTLDGRFDMIAAILSLVLLRIEAEGEAGRAPSATLIERFVEDMDGQLRQIGIGDIIVGKHIGKMMSALGGRLGAYREGMEADDLRPALARNLYRGAEVAPGALSLVDVKLRQFSAALGETPFDRLTEGALPTP